MKERGIALAAIAVVAILVDCGGGGGGGGAVAPTNVPTAGATAAAAGYAKATFSITVPPGATTSATTRKPQLVTANTKSITFTLLATTATGVPTGTASGAFALTAGSPGCTSTAAGVTCTLALNAPVGTDAYVANVYSSTNATSGTQVGSGSVALTVQANASNTASLTLNGPVASVLLATTNYVLTDGTVNIAGKARKPAVAAASVNLSSQIVVIGLDANGNAVLNPSTYNQPIVLTLDYPSPPSANFITLTDVSTITGTAQTTSVSTNGGQLSVVAPSDVVTITMTPGVTTFFSELFVLSQIGTGPAPGLPSPGAFSLGNFIPFTVSSGGPAASSPTPPPTPTPTPTPAGLAWTNPVPLGQPNGVAFTNVNPFGNPSEFALEIGAPNPMPSTGGPISYTLGLASNYAFGGSYSFTDGGTGTPCVAGGYLSQLPANVPAIGTANQSANVTLSFIGGQAGSCQITASDGNGNSSYLDINVNNPNITVQGHRRAP